MGTFNVMGRVTDDKCSLASKGSAVFFLGSFTGEPNKSGPVTPIITVAAYLEVETIREFERTKLRLGDGPNISRDHGLHNVPILECGDSISSPRQRMSRLANTSF